MAAAILSNQNSSGFYKAPVCKGLLSSIFITFTVAHAPVLSLSPYIRANAFFEVPWVLSSQIWRLILNRFTVMYSKDFLCAALLLYYFRIFERRMGSRKFASQVLGTSIIATLLEMSAIVCFSSYYRTTSEGRMYLPPGLHSLIFPFFINYFMDIPKITVTKILGIPITAKSLTYLLGVQMASSDVDSAIAAAAGLVAGILYRCNVFYVKKWLFVPEAVANLCSRMFGWFFTGKPIVHQMGATLELQRQEEMERYEQQFIYRRAQDFYSSRPQAEPSEENIALLVQMGFDRTRSIEALRASGNNLSTATSILLRQ